MADVTSVRESLASWIVDDVSVGALVAANDIWIRARVTKTEVYCLRAMRDSRKKGDHLLKYTNSFTEDTKVPWQEHLFEPLVKAIQDIIG
jgi:hypothetical protein